jgi:hypothetical protein
MYTRFCHSGDTAAFGFDAHGKFTAVVVGTFRAGTRSQLIASAAYSPSSEWDVFYREVFNLLRRYGKRKLQSDSPLAASVAIKDTVRQLGFKRQKTQDKGTTNAGCVRLVHSLSRWDCCHYSRLILLLAKLVKSERAFEKKTAVGDLVVSSLIRNLNDELIRYVLEFV